MFKSSKGKEGFFMFVLKVSFTSNKETKYSVQSIGKTQFYTLVQEI